MGFHRTVHQASRTRRRIVPVSWYAAMLAVALQVMPLRRAAAESWLDLKTMYYQESHDRIQVVAPSFLYQMELSPTLSIKIDGVYDSISGATPTGAPPKISGSDGAAAAGVVGLSRRSKSARAGGFLAKAGATPISEPAAAPTPEPTVPTVSEPTTSSSSSSSPSSAVASSSVSSSSAAGPSAVGAAEPTAAAATSSGAAGYRLPLAEIEDNRFAGNLQITRSLDRHVVSGQVSLSTEDDYDSVGVSVKDSIGFRDRNTTLTLGSAYSYDTLDVFWTGDSDNREVVDVMLGLDQLLSRRTVLTANYVVGVHRGFLSDQYKVVELNGETTPENRPDDNTRHVLYVRLAHGFEGLRSGLAADHRFSTDSFGVQAHTTSLTWHRKLGDAWLVSPVVRYHDQSEADFYATRFTGTPRHYSSDYRISSMTTLSYGLKVAWRCHSRVSIDAAYDRYEQDGNDGETSDDAYASADIVTVGGRLWF